MGPGGIVIDRNHLGGISGGRVGPFHRHRLGPVQAVGGTLVTRIVLRLHMGDGVVGRRIGALVHIVQIGGHLVVLHAVNGLTDSILPVQIHIDGAKDIAHQGQIFKRRGVSSLTRFDGNGSGVSTRRNHHIQMPGSGVFARSHRSSLGKRNGRRGR